MLIVKNSERIGLAREDKNRWLDFMECALEVASRGEEVRMLWRICATESSFAKYSERFKRYLEILLDAADVSGCDVAIDENGILGNGLLTGAATIKLRGHNNG